MGVSHADESFAGEIGHRIGVARDGSNLLRKTKCWLANVKPLVRCEAKVCCYEILEITFTGSS
jgi:hypothetical protein